MNCINCNHNKSYFYLTENGFNFYKCSACLSIFLWPLTDIKNRNAALELGLHFGEIKLNTINKIKLNKIKYYLFIIKLFNLNTYFKNNIQTLDIGSGHGEFLFTLKKINPKLNLFSVEPHLEKNNTLNLNNIHSVLNLEQVNTTFSFISLLNVYSHLTNPTKTLQTIFEKLNKNGFLLIQTGNTSMLNAKQHPLPLLAPDHVLFTNQNALTDLLQKLNFTIIKIHHLPSPYSYKSKHFIKTILKFILKRIPWQSIKHGNKATDMWVLCKKN